MVDPREITLPTNVNEELLNRSLRHAVFIQKFKTHEANKLVSFLNDEVLPDLVDQMRQRLPSAIGTPGHLTNLRLKALYETNKQILRAGLSQANSILAKDMKEFALSEAEWQTKVFNKATPSVFGIDYTTPPPSLLKSIVTSNPFDGRILKDHFSKLSSDAQKNIKSSINKGIANGESLQKMMRRVRGSLADRYSKGNLGELRRHTEAITRTSVAHVTNNARIATYSENDHVVKGYQFLATLDSRTTEQCMVRDGKIFPLDNALDMPPLHYQCRSDTTPVLKTWEELDIKGVKEAPEGTRAALGGPVSGKVNYPEWLAKQPKKMQDLALGKGRAALFREGKLPFENLVNSKDKPLTLKQLRRLSEKTDGIKMAPVVTRESPSAIIKPRQPSARPPSARTLLTGRQVRSRLKDNLGSIDDDIKSVNSKMENLYKTGWTGASNKSRTLRYLDRKNKRLHSKKLQLLSDELKVDDGMKVDFETRRITSSRTKGDVDTARRFLETIVSKNVGRKTRTHIYPITGNERSFFRKGSIHLARNGRVKDIVHEFGHKLEDINDNVRNAAQEFLRKRALEDPDGLRSLNDIVGTNKFNPAESAWKDKFLSPYMGKYYSDGSTEIISKGLELMWQDPMRLMTKDPEYFDFIVDIIRGHIP
jgi:SPP1 gp7 family putative phage head morphogenesis protein